MALKLPLQNKKIKIPIINRKFSALVVVLAVLVAGGVWYFKFRDTKTGVTTGIKRVTIADAIQAAAVPQLVKPSTSIKVSGTFTDIANQPVETASAKYYVFQEEVNEGRKLVGSGLLGNNVSSFQRVIPLSGLTVGRYSILITDENINLADYGLLNIGPGPYGTGQAVGVPSDAVPPLSGVIQPTLGYGSGR